MILPSVGATGIANARQSIGPISPKHFPIAIWVFLAFSRVLLTLDAIFNIFDRIPRIVELPSTKKGSFNNKLYNIYMNTYGADKAQRLKENLGLHIVNRKWHVENRYMWRKRTCAVSDQASQSALVRQLKLSLVVWGQHLDGWLSRLTNKQLTLPSFGRDVKLGVLRLDAACIVGLN